MNNAGTITMTMRALDRMKVIQALVDGNIRFCRKKDAVILRLGGNLRFSLRPSAPSARDNALLPP